MGINCTSRTRAQPADKIFTALRSSTAVLMLSDPEEPSLNPNLIPPLFDMQIHTGGRWVTALAPPGSNFLNPDLHKSGCSCLV